MRACTRASADRSGRSPTCRRWDIAALDVVYGLRSDIESGREYMAHRTGFTGRTLARRLNAAGFVQIQIATTDEDLVLWARARRPAA